jgi:hypothetical protein
MKIDHLVTSISELSEREAMELVLTRRQSRRERPERVAKARTTRAKKEPQPPKEDLFAIAMRLAAEIKKKQ